MGEKPFRPMLATDFEEDRLVFPYYASPKLDGIRCLVLGGEARTRSLKRFPNRHVHEWFQEHGTMLANLDGELIVGEPTAKDCYNRTNSGLMARDGTPNFRFHVFDRVDFLGVKRFWERADMAQKSIKNFHALAASADATRVVWLGQSLAREYHELCFYEEKMLEQGYEGVMIRHPESPYKQGRATIRENFLLKVKRFKDAEAIIVGTEERLHNGNEAQVSELGLTKRSSHKVNMVPTGTLGAILAEGAPDQPFAGVRFSIGTGLDDAQRAALWARRGDLVGQRVKYRFFEVGVKDAPRFPVFIGLRSELDT